VPAHTQGQHSVAYRESVGAFMCELEKGFVVAREPGEAVVGGSGKVGGSGQLVGPGLGYGGRSSHDEVAGR
jgi:hypothetical protein